MCISRTGSTTKIKLEWINTGGRLLQDQVIGDRPLVFRSIFSPWERAVRLLLCYFLEFCLYLGNETPHGNETFDAVDGAVHNLDRIGYEPPAVDLVLHL